MTRQRVTRKYLETLTDQLNDVLGRPMASYELGRINLDYASCYGGYALREIDNDKGGETFYWPRWSRVSAREMEAYLLGQLDLVRLQSWEK